MAIKFADSLVHRHTIYMYTRYKFTLNTQLSDHLVDVSQAHDKSPHAKIEVNVILTEKPSINYLNLLWIRN